MESQETIRKRRWLAKYFGKPSACGPQRFRKNGQNDVKRREDMKPSSAESLHHLVGSPHAHEALAERDKIAEATG